MKDIMFWVRRFVMIYGIIMICMFFMCLFFNPTSQLPVVSFFGRIIIFTLLGMATLIVYYSKEELTQRQWWIRTVLHLVILEAIFLPLAHHWEFWHRKLDAVDFYNKCGFSKETEYRYSVKDKFCMGKSAGEIFMPVNTADEQMKQKYMDMVRCSASNSSLEQRNKFGLQMFYTADMENVYYTKDIDCFIVAEVEDDTMLLQSIISENKVSLSEIISHICKLYHKCRLGFTPAQKDMDICVAEQYDGADDYRLFYLGDQLKSIENEKLYFPELSHA